jgi:hypothetical protein
MYGVWHWDGSAWIEDYVGPALWLAMAPLNHNTGMYRYYGEYPPGGDMPVFTSMVPPNEVFNPFTRTNQAVA